MESRPRHYVVIDLEATCCNDNSFPREHMEIIEIGAVLVDGERLTPVAEHQSFVRPFRRARLTPFCMELTTITQEQVDAAPRFPQAIAALRAFLEGKGAVFCSWGDYDRTQLQRDARLHNVQLPLSAVHINLKRRFAERRGEPRELGTYQALRKVGLPPTGTHHRAIDDARNIARLLPWTVGNA
jgi:3'-5' exoribonuclease 1